MHDVSEPLTGSTLLGLLRDPADSRAWDLFVRRYGPLIHRWCLRWRLQEADADNVTQEVLAQLVQKLHSFRYDPRKGTFRGWLRTLTQHAWSDYLAKNREALRSTGDSDVPKRLENVEARADLMASLAEAFDLELLEHAQTRVRLRVTPRDWQIFQELSLEQRPGRAVARELGMTVTAVLMAKSRVQKKLREEIGLLEGVEPRPREERP
jgi:RNA polymerase sigma-70 factor (ECF subfamily)